MIWCRLGNGGKTLLNYIQGNHCRACSKSVLTTPFGILIAQVYFLHFVRTVIEDEIVRRYRGIVTLEIWLTFRFKFCIHFAAEEKKNVESIIC